MNFTRNIDIPIELQPNDIHEQLLYEIVEEFTNFLIDEYFKENIPHKDMPKVDKILSEIKSKLKIIQFPGQTN